MKRRLCRYLPVIFIILYGIFTPFLSDAIQNRILQFDSRIVVHQDSSLTVREVITVQSDGEWLKDGFKYYFITRTIGKWGAIRRSGFSLIGVLKDGASENCPIEEVSKGIQIHIGKQGLSGPGIHTFTLTYKRDRQIKHFDDHDELSRIMTDSWGVPIDKITATVVLPSKASQNILSYDGQIRPESSRSKDLTVSLDPMGNIVYATTLPLAPSESLAVTVSWRKGTVFEPTQSMKIDYFLRDNKIVVFVFIGLIVVFLYDFSVWRRVGRDPKKDIIYPIYSPPLGMSPALMRYVIKMRYDDKVFSSAIIDLIVKGRVGVQKDDQIYTLVRSNTDRAELPREERHLLEKLFASENKIVLLAFNNERMNITSDALGKDLSIQAERIHFCVNRCYVIPGLILSFLSLATILISGEVEMGTVLGFLVLGAPILAVLLYLTVMIWSTFLTTRKGKYEPFWGGILISIFTIAFLWIGIQEIFWEISPLFAILLVAFPSINGLFYYLLKAPTRGGRSLLNQIEGFKMFLNAAEKDRFNTLHPMGEIPERFEKYLPYALALDIEQPWAELFTEIVNEARMVKTNSSRTSSIDSLS